MRALSRFWVTPAPESGDKLTRFGPFSSQCRAGNVKIRRGSWTAGPTYRMAVLSRQHDPRLGPSSYIRIGRLAHEGDRWFESHSLQWRVHGPHDAARGAPFRAASRSIRCWRLGSAFAASVCSPRARNCHNCTAFDSPPSQCASLRGMVFTTCSIALGTSCPMLLL